MHATEVTELHDDVGNCTEATILANTRFLFNDELQSVHYSLFLHHFNVHIYYGIIMSLFICYYILLEMQALRDHCPRPAIRDYNRDAGNKGLAFS